MKLQSKYDKGQKVYKAMVKEESKYQPCHVCNDARRVKAKIEIAGEYIIDCPECKDSEKIPTSTVYTEVILSLTIDKIFYNLHSDEKFEYSCVETGRQVFPEEELFGDIQEAEERAKQLKEIKEHF